MSTGWSSIRPSSVAQVAAGLALGIGLIWVGNVHSQKPTIAPCVVLYGSADTGATLPPGMDFNPPLWFNAEGINVGWANAEDDKIFTPDSPSTCK